MLWRKANVPPPHPASMVAWQKKAADAMHVLLYILIFAVPVSGYLYTLAAGVPVVVTIWRPFSLAVSRASAVTSASGA